MSMILIEHRRSLLVIDDDESILRVFRRIFEKNGYVVFTAQSGKEAEEKLEENCFDATLFDLKLPYMNGTDLLPFMMKTDPDMVKIALTGLPESDIAVEEVKRGVDAFLSKPVKPETLLTVLETELKHRKR